MKTKHVATWSAVAYLLFSTGVYAQDYVGYAGQTDTHCGDGTEIKDYKSFKSPDGTFFSNYSFDPVGPIINPNTGAGQVGCSIQGTQETNGRTTVVGVLAHADCGHGGGPIVRAYCRFTASLGNF